jgi:hypothetical protein
MKRAHFSLADVNNQERKRALTLVTVQDDNSPGIGIWIDGCSTKTADNEEPDAVAYLEIQDGKPMLYVYADINQEDPTHAIDLSGARTNRRLTTFKGHFYFKDDTGAKTHVSAFEMQAVNANELEKMLLDKFWDPRLDAASCVPWPEYEVKV